MADENSGESERSPLLTNDHLTPGSNYEGTTNQEGGQIFLQPEEQHLEPQSVDSGASSYEGSVEQLGGPTVICRVCSATIYIEGKTKQHVVKCSHCNEATPIRAAPPGKKYVRCPCNCLLLCKAASSRIACPRANCKRVITLQDNSPMGTALRAPAGTSRVACAHCQEVFMFNTLSNTAANCPHCKKVSSVGSHYARSRAITYFILAVVVAVLGVGLTLGTLHVAKGNVLLYVVWAVVYIIAILLFLRFLYFATLKTSQVLGPL
ncbi:hypothetical protein AB6A40_007715 [Gnathostoma spinigerum]|uniref:Phosphatidylinositol-4,5-bisphosphate 4-phosphatase n=1 Tax=Gnathostoma spinigerum TaxID=75299 RepID=A0ABD6EMJ4_9BILA